MEPAVHPDPLTSGAPHPDGDDARAASGPGLYVHVPFCATRCRYCAFSSGSISAGAVETYLAGMEREAEMRAMSAAGLEFRTVFIGGGTPSALSSRHFARMWSAVRGSFRITADAEITIEANPESVRPSLLEAWSVAGINRLSMGAQSAHADELEGMGRLHAPERPAEALALARAHGFRRLSLDLMFGFPGHGPERWAATVQWALDLDPGHLSAYAFIPEAGTPMGDAVRCGDASVPDDDAQAESFAVLNERCRAAGYGAYETSNFCRPGAEARHNLGYWLRRPYVAVGPSAHGFAGGERYANHYGLEVWAAALGRGTLPEASRERVSGAESARETVMLGLRLTAGLRRCDYPAAAWEGLLARYAGVFARACRTGRLQTTAEGWRIPDALAFLADDVIAWIDAGADADERSRSDAGLTVSVPAP